MPDDYLHGHPEPVLRSHRWRTAENSAGYLLPHLAGGERLLDVGCGPGTITADLAGRVASAVGVDSSADVVAEAERSVADRPEVDRPSFRVADVYELPFDDGEFDVVHAHQVLQHLTDPVAALREMARVARPGGLVAARDSDYGAFTWAPEAPGVSRWLDRYRSVARSLGAEPDAGRRLLGWCQEAGLAAVTASASVWCFSGDDREWWAGVWSDRIRTEPLRGRLLADGADEAELDAMVASWQGWAAAPDGWFAVLHGEVLAQV
ncbi:methyltransferase domain-containing protein [Dermatobacter hominis]|uniref:methyltransferase domain-containing protein n=1 Tax=Dermatobacter hominis TaxID=2884263 RepID=UPI001D11CCF8|nr:methyltransferase domain-containing protein [Dermatobacter hominis]UDY37860.1 methyltransferase domain-containing protein [Dermatobacter hominis]